MVTLTVEKTYANGLYASQKQFDGFKLIVRSFTEKIQRTQNRIKDVVNVFWDELFRNNRFIKKYGFVIDGGSAVRSVIQPFLTKVVSFLASTCVFSFPEKVL